MATPMSGWDTAGAVLPVLWALGTGTAVAVLAYANRGPVRPWAYRGSVAMIGFGVLGHLQEHVAQAAYWLGHPNSPAWRTAWRRSCRAVRRPAWNCCT
jgi:hypothetical protein